MKGKVSKATKRYQKKHLSREITQRKVAQKKKALRERGKHHDAADDGRASDSGGEGENEEIEDGADGMVAAPAARKLSQKVSGSKNASFSSVMGSGKGKDGAASRKKAPPMADMDVDEFMDGAFLEDDEEEEAEEERKQRKAADKALQDEEGDEEEDEEDEGEDDEEEADEDDEAALLAEIEAHEAELRNLEKSDPEFFKHLQEHDQELLNFSKEEIMGAKRGGHGDEEGEEADGMDEDDEEDAGQKAEVLTLASLNQLKRQVLVHGSLKGLKALVRAFRSAAYMGDASNAGSKDEQEKRRHSQQQQQQHQLKNQVAIHDSRVFNELIRFTLKEAANIFAKQFKPVAPTQDGKASKKKKQVDDTTTQSSLTHLDRHPRWSRVGPVLKAFLSSFLHLLQSLPNSNPKMARFVLGVLEGFVVLFEPFPKIANQLLKQLLAIWSSAERDVRIEAFLRIRQMAIELTTGVGTMAHSRGGESMLELALKGLYLTFVRHSKFVTQLNQPVMDFMSNCVVELYGLDPTLSYQHAFVYIRQLAIHLRQALMAKKKDSHRMVYNWNYISCLRVWSKVLAAHGQPASTGAGGATSNDNLSALVYPFVQVCLGTLTVLPSSRYFPLRFQVVNFLLPLCRATRVFVPLAPHLLSVLSAPELGRKPVASTRKVQDIRFQLRASKHVIATKNYQESCVGEALSLLLHYFALYSHSIAFNELVIPALKSLKRTMKELAIPRIRKQVQNLVLKLEHNMQWITEKRNASNIAPKDLLAPRDGVDAMQTFKSDSTSSSTHKKGPASASAQSPLDKYVHVEIAERKSLDESKADWVGAASIGKRGGGDSDEEDDEEDDRHAGRGHEEDDGYDDEMDEDEETDDDEEGDDDDVDAGEDESDAPPRKKSKSSSTPRKPFQYPAGFDHEDGEDADLLQELDLSDDDEDMGQRRPASKKTKAKQQQKPKKEKKENGIKMEKKNQGPNKKQQQQQKTASAAAAGDGKKRKRA